MLKVAKLLRFWIKIKLFAAKNNSFILKINKAILKKIKS